MADPSGSGAPSGVPCNSALSFVASAQRVQPETQDVNQNEQLIPEAPAGVKALCEACTQLYPDQPNPLQVTTRLKYWLGGQDPLDYISMYRNPGRPEENIPPHWHYISFGLSDLHGDGRVHAPRSAEPHSPSGFGLEITFRLSSDEPQPPLWPAALLQALARYIFTTGNKLCAGDHISWHRPLDGVTSRGRMRHLLVAAEPQLRLIRTAHGTVTFLQIVGCTNRELKAAQRSSVFDVLKLIAQDPKCGGSWFVTRMDRRISVKLDTGNVKTLAQLAGVSSDVRWYLWSDHDRTNNKTSINSVEDQIKETLQRGLNDSRGGVAGHMSTDSFEMSSMEKALPKLSTESSWREDTVEYLEGVHLIMNAEGASLLPLAIEGRILHGAHFTWRGDLTAVTLVASDVVGSYVSADKPYATKGSWLQILISKELATEILSHRSVLNSIGCGVSDSEDESSSTSATLPLTMCWRKHALAITVCA